MAAKTEKSSETPLSPDVLVLKDLYELMLTEGLDLIELKDDERRIRLSRRLSVPPPTPAVTAARSLPSTGIASTSLPDNIPEENKDAIAAPLAGVFYRASSPTGAPFTKEGDTVDPGQTLCIVEAMKVMNEIKADKRCRIVKIAAENSRPVTVGQALFWIEPA